MTFILTNQIKETLYVTSIKMSLPVHNITIKPEDIVNEDVINNWKENNGYCRFSLPINEKIDQFRNVFNMRRKSLLEDLMYDGVNYLFYASQLEDFLINCKQMTDDYNRELETLLEYWEEIKIEFKQVLNDKLEVALREQIDNVHDRESTRVKLVESYMTNNFPTAIKTKSKCRFDYDTPRPYIVEEIPAGLSDAAIESMKASTAKGRDLMFDMLFKTYDELETEFLPLFYTGVISKELDIEFINEDIKFLIDNDIFVLETDETEEDDLMMTLSLRGVHLSVSQREKYEYIKSRVRKRSDIRAYKNLQSKLLLLSSNLSNTVALFEETTNSHIETVVTNTHKLIACFDAYYEQRQLEEELKVVKPKRKRSKKVTEDDNEIVPSVIQTETVITPVIEEDEDEEIPEVIVANDVVTIPTIESDESAFWDLDEDFGLETEESESDLCF